MQFWCERLICRIMLDDLDDVNKTLIGYFRYETRGQARQLGQADRRQLAS